MSLENICEQQLILCNQTVLRSRNAQTCIFYPENNSTPTCICCIMSNIEVCPVLFWQEAAVCVCVCLVLCRSRASRLYAQQLWNFCHLSLNFCFPLLQGGCHTYDIIVLCAHQCLHLSWSEFNVFCLQGGRHTDGTTRLCTGLFQWRGAPAWTVSDEWRVDGDCGQSSEYAVYPTTCNAATLACYEKTIDLPVQTSTSGLLLVDFS